MKTNCACLMRHGGTHCAGCLDDHGPSGVADPVCHQIEIGDSSAETIGRKKEIKKALATDGFARFKPGGQQAYAEAIREVAAAFGDLPFDPFDKNGCRKRRFQRYTLLPWAMKVEKRPVTYYEQGADYNPDAKGLRREFGGLNGALGSNRWLIELIQLNFELLPWEEEHLRGPIDCGIHFIRYLAKPGVPAVSSPAGFHRDGEPYTTVHIIDRKDIMDDSGMTEIAKDARGENLLARFQLVEPFEAAIVTDALVFHRVTPVVVAKGKSEGYRDVILIDFAPMRRDLTRFTPVANELEMVN